MSRSQSRLALKAGAKGHAECLQDVVSHANSFESALRGMRDLCCECGDVDSAAYWDHEIGVLHRLVNQASEVIQGGDIAHGELQSAANSATVGDDAPGYERARM